MIDTALDQWADIVENGRRHPRSYEDHLQAQLNGVNAKPTGMVKILKSTGNQYADDAAIDGLRYFAGSKIGSRASQVFWGVIFLGSLILGIVVFDPIWHSYMNKATLNLQETIEMSEFEFPAITFCNYNMFKRSLVGHQYANFMKTDPYMTHNVLTWGEKVCGAQPFYKPVTNFNDSTSWYETTFFSPERVGYRFGYHMMLLVQPTSYNTVQSCRFKGRKLTDYECYSAFQNRVLSDNKVCFTFNPSDSLRRYSTRDIGSNVPDYLSTIFPAPLPGVIDFKIKARGGATAVELVLNIQQFEYCNTGSSDGAGMEVQVHSRDVQPLIKGMMSNVIHLSPGKDTTLVIEERHIVRETESAGWCSKHVPLKYYNHLKTYDRNACYTECITDKIIQYCNCLPDFIPVDAMKNVYKELTKLFPENTMKRMIALTKRYCFGKVNGTFCQAATIGRLLAEKSIGEECGQCKVPCFETNYLVEKTELNFPALNNFDLYQDLKHPKVNYTALRQLTNSSNFIGASYVMENVDRRTYGVAESFRDVEEIEQNLMHVRIQLKSMQVVIHTEKFAVSISELVTQFGGTISLFIGASMLSFIEIGFWCVIAARNACRGAGRCSEPIIKINAIDYHRSRPISSNHSKVTKTHSE